MYQAPKTSYVSDTMFQFIVYALVIGAFVLMTQTGACSVNKQRFQGAAQNAGLESAVRGGYDYFECGNADVWVSSISAKRGDDEVSGTMCCGIFKGCTVRWQ